MTTIRRRWPTALVGVLLLVAFGLHAALFGAWIVDDAGISLAYARNLADGAGLVAQPGATRVEGYSNPAWVLIMAGCFAVGLVGRFRLFGVPDYVIVVKGLALIAHAVVLACLFAVIERVLRAWRGRPPTPALTLAVWAGTGLLLAATPSYVIWMVSGLENPLLAATVAALALVAIKAIERPTPRLALTAGVLVGIAATTRPDGIIYLAVLPAIVLLAVGAPRRQRLAHLLLGLAACTAVVVGLLGFRLWYFGAWVPNTAVAKGQDVPTIADLARLDQLAGAFGPWVLAVGTVGVAVALAVMWRRRNALGWRVATVGLLVLALGVLAFVVLNPDWMTELRFLTAAWPLLSVAVVLGVAQLVALVPATRWRAATMSVALLAVAADVPSRIERSTAFAATPNVPLCYVAERFGAHFDTAARLLGLETGETTVLLPDVGGTLLTSNLRVVDLAGLTDARIAGLREPEERPALVDLILDELRPTFIHVHGPWVRNSGLRGDVRFQRDYIELVRGRDFVRRDALHDVDRGELAVIRAKLADDASAADATRGTAPLRACDTLLFRRST